MARPKGSTNKKKRVADKKPYRKKKETLEKRKKGDVGKENDKSENKLGLFIQEKRKYFQDLQQLVPVTEQYIQKLKEQASQCTSRHLFKRKKDLEKEISLLYNKIQQIKNKEEENSFEQKAAQYLQVEEWIRLNKNKTAQTSVILNKIQEQHPLPLPEQTKKDLSLLTKEYLTDIEKEPPMTQVILEDMCNTCEEPLLISSNGAELKCPICGYGESALDATSSLMAYGDELEYPSNGYLQLNHFKGWLYKTQGKETKRVKDEFINQVMEVLFTKMHITDSERITLDDVRKALKILKEKYDHLTQIWCRITGKPAPTLTPELEETFCIMFLIMLPIYNKYKPPKRANFLPYSYFLYKCAQLLNLLDLLPWLKLLKCKKLLEQCETIFRLMCLDVGWPFIEIQEKDWPHKKLKL